MKKSNRGGIRKGSGRRVIGKKKKEPVTIYVPLEDIDLLGGKEVVRQAALSGVDFHVQRKQ